MMNLSLYELRQIAKGRNISDCENKSEEDLEKAIIETKPKPEPKQKPKLETKPKPEPELKPKQTPESKQAPETKPKRDPKLEIKVNKEKLKKLRKDFDEFRDKFSNKDEIKEYRQAFYGSKKNTNFLNQKQIR